MPTPARLRRFLPAVAAAAVMALTGAAPAQFGEAAGFGEMMSPYFFRRDLNLFAEGLGLDEGQAAIVESLYWDYEDEHEAGKASMLSRLSEMREELKEMERDQVLQLVFQPFEDRATEWNAMREDFLESVQAILNRDQLDRWPEFRRELRREKELPKGRFSGESVDLFHVIRDLELDKPTRESIADLMQGYAITLDESLARREDLLHESRLAMMHSMRDDDADTALDIYEKQVETRVAIRRTNDDYLEAIGRALPPAIGAEFTKRALQQGYSRIYRPTAAERIFGEALKIDDLAGDVRQAITDLQAAMMIEIENINQTLTRLIREYEPIEARYRATTFAMRAARSKADKPKDPTREHFRDREDTGRRYVEQLRSILTPEQFAGLPGAQRFLRRTTGTDAKGAGLGAGAASGADAKRQKEKMRQRSNRDPLGGANGSGGGRR